MKVTMSVDEQDLVELHKFLRMHSERLNEQRWSSIARVKKEIESVLRTTLSIDAEIVGMLSAFTGIAADRINSDHLIQLHLGIPAKRLPDLAEWLTKSMNELYATSKSITTSEVANLTTVQSCIDLVKRRLQEESYSFEAMRS